MFKDEVLCRLADTANVAQFVSFSPDVKQRHCRLLGYEPDHMFSSPEQAIRATFAISNGSVNIRTYLPEDPSGHPFHYGLQDIEEVLTLAKQRCDEGLYILVFETVDVNDGGLGGIVLDKGYLEFSPGVCPRFVEGTPDSPIPVFPREIGLALMRSVYGFAPDLSMYDDSVRVELSIHPGPRGWKHDRTIIWEEGVSKSQGIEPFYVWPNAFSRLLGDKAYGLLMADVLGLPVPRTMVFPRNRKVAPFVFGATTGTEFRWTRTCPIEQEPGKFSTLAEWKDPFALMDDEDPDGSHLASCLVQDQVSSLYSGAVITDDAGRPVIEGVKGFGDVYMLGQDEEVFLPQNIRKDVQNLYEETCSRLYGPCRFEWAHDGKKAWILQLHKGKTKSSGRTVYPGTPVSWENFPVQDGLEALRKLIVICKPYNHGIRLVGNVGMGSHMADLLRRFEVPSEIVPAGEY